MDSKLKHLELIQGVINRLASDSFRMKGWTVVLVAAVFVFLARQNAFEAGYIALLPIAAFWGLDGYFLWQERLFRAHYDNVRTRPAENVDFAMDVRAYKGPLRLSWVGTTFSRTLVFFYGALLAFVLVAVLGVGGEPESAAMLRGVHAPTPGNG
ncbi:MAG: hypothetical protein OXU77_14330 [Gammaproteobacteria bacterium]|nr:hypothetical protein [Gammaproteobacteria bacterium]